MTLTRASLWLSLAMPLSTEWTPGETEGRPPELSRPVPYAARHTDATAEGVACQGHPLLSDSWLAPEMEGHVCHSGQLRLFWGSRSSHSAPRPAAGLGTAGPPWMSVHTAVHTSVCPFPETHLPRSEGILSRPREAQDRGWEVDSAHSIGFGSQHWVWHAAKCFHTHDLIVEWVSLPPGCGRKTETHSRPWEAGPCASLPPDRGPEVCTPCQPRAHHFLPGVISLTTTLQGHRLHEGEDRNREVEGPP